MIGSGIMLLENWMMNDGSSHARDYESCRSCGQPQRFLGTDGRIQFPWVHLKEAGLLYQPDEGLDRPAVTRTRAGPTG